MTDKRVTKTACVTFLACEGTWRLAGHELKPNRDVRPRAHTTQHVHPCAPTKSASLPPCPYLTFVLPFTLHSAAMYPRTGCDTAEADAGQHRLIRSAPSRPADVLRTLQSHIMVYHHHARQGLTLLRTHDVGKPEENLPYRPDLR